MPLPSTPTIQYDDIILLVGKDRRTFIRTVTPGKQFQCHLGVIQLDDLVGMRYGDQAPTHLGHKLFVMTPSTDDVIRHLQREGQIIFPKDLGYIVMKMGIRPGMHVLEAGTGSGALTLTLALLVGNTGHVYSYERQPRMHEQAMNNLRRYGLLDRVTLHLREIERGFEERDIDAIFLDVREPWEYLPQVREALRGGGFFGALVPTINQVITLTEHLYEGPWFFLEIEELLLRQYKTIPARIRPDDQMVGHTGYLVFARAVDREAQSTWMQNIAEGRLRNRDTADDSIADDNAVDDNITDDGTIDGDTIDDGTVDNNAAEPQTGDDGDTLTTTPDDTSSDVE